MSIVGDIHAGPVRKDKVQLNAFHRGFLTFSIVMLLAFGMIGTLAYLSMVS